MRFRSERSGIRFEKWHTVDTAMFPNRSPPAPAPVLRLPGWGLGVMWRYEELRMRTCIQAAPKPALGSKSMPSPDLGLAHERVKLPRHITPKYPSGYYRGNG